MNDMNIQISIGVDSCCFVLEKPCAKQADLNTSVTISFFLSGPFLAAAITDDLNKTIDYSELSEHLIRSLKHFDCGSYATITEKLKTEISKFSPLISNGYLQLNLQCHEAFRQVICLL